VQEDSDIAIIEESEDPTGNSYDLNGLHNEKLFRKADGSL